MAEPGEIPTLEPKPALKRPGGAYSPKPVIIEGKTYDPFHPPKLVQNPDGTQGFIGGKELTKDEVYADRFWRKTHPPGLREALIENIQKDAQAGTIGIFVSETGIAEEDREKLSAYRELARELGFEIGQFTFHKNAGTATATIKKNSK